MSSKESKFIERKADIESRGYTLETQLPEFNMR